MRWLNELIQQEERAARELGTAAGPTDHPTHPAPPTDNTPGEE